MDFRLPFNRVVKLNVYELPTAETFGILNRTADNFFVPFFDYDNVNREVVDEEIDFFEKNFRLGPALVRKTSSFITDSKTEIGSYHLVYFCKLTLPEYVELLKVSRCDSGFKAGFRLEPERAWVHRIGLKIDIKTGLIVKPATRFECFRYFKTRRLLNRGMFQFYSSLEDNGKMKSGGLKFDDVNNIFFIYYTCKDKRIQNIPWVAYRRDK